MTEEGKIQKKIIDYYEAHDCIVIKLMKTNKNGIPDLLVIERGGKCFFIEAKTKKGILSSLQRYVHKWLRSFGITVHVWTGVNENFEEK